MRTLIIVVAALVLLIPGTVGAQGHDDIRPLQHHIEAAIDAARRADTAALRLEVKAIEESWSQIEDGVRTAHPDLYREIESALGAFQTRTGANPVDFKTVTPALEALEHEVDTLAAAAPGTRTASTPATASTTSLGALLPKLKEATAALKRGDVAMASRELREFREGWPDVEGAVAAKDGAAYKRSENLMAGAADDLAAQPPRTATALTAIEQLGEGLEPFVAESLSYGIFDAAAILLREGLEALLVIAALLAFLQKSGNADKRIWIWGGGIAGVLVSILGAILIQRFFSSVITGANREVIEGITGLVAAVMLFYVSFWLHRRTQIQGWQRYIREKTSAALATGSLFSLATLAFLAVFREGAETTLFYIGIAPSIAQRDLWIGLLIAMAILAIAGIAIMVLGRRLPLRPFFQITSLLIFYLGFKFIGAGIHALQVAGVLPASTSGYLPSVGVIGLYPTWESTTLQVIMLVIAATVVLWLHRRNPKQDQMRAAA